MLNLLRSLFWWFRPINLVKWAVALGLIAVVWGVINYDKLKDYFVVRERWENNRDEVAHLEKTKADMQKEQAELKAGGFSTEKSIRERLYMIKPGEKVLFVEPPAPAPSPGGVESTSDTSHSKTN